MNQGLQKLLSRFLGLFLFAVVIGLVSECNAQLFKRNAGWRRRHARVQQAPVPQEATLQQVVREGNGAAAVNTQQPAQPGYFNQTANPRGFRLFAAPRNFDWGPHRFRSSNELYPKYTGAFHSSHYSNLGVPSGDIGFRGNGIYWQPW